MRSLSKKRSKKPKNYNKKRPLKRLKLEMIRERLRRPFNSPRPPRNSMLLRLIKLEPKLP